MPRARQRFTLVTADGREVPLPAGRHVAGADPGCAIPITGDGVADEHVVLTVAADRVFCQVRRPELELCVNEQSTQGEVLRPGDRLQIGDGAYTLRATIDADVPEGETPKIVRVPSEQATFQDLDKRLHAGLIRGDAEIDGLDLTYRLAQLVGVVDDLSRFAAELLRLVAAAVPTRQAFFVRFGAGDRFVVEAAHPPGALHDRAAGPSSTILGRVLRDGVSLITTDARRDPRLVDSRSITASAIRTAVCAPVRDGEELLGALYADARPDDAELGLEALTLLESIASFAGLALGRTNLYQALRQRELHTHLLVHDLKNPIAAVMSGTELLQRGVGNASELAGSIRRAAERLDGYVRDLLSVARLQEVGLSPRRTPVPLMTLLDEVDRRWRRTFELAGLELVVQASPTGAVFDLDRHLVDRVIDNLVDNAVQHAPPSSHVEVSLAVGADGLTCRVVDRGPGVPEELRGLIFDKYGRAQPGGVGGRGVGLYFCRLAVEAHGGAIWVEGCPRDNRFVFTLQSAS